MMLCKGFSLLYFPFPCQRHSHISLASSVHLVFDHFVFQLTLLGLMVRPHKCSIWSPYGLPPGFSLLANFCCMSDELMFWATCLGFFYYFYSLQNVSNEDVCHAKIFLKLKDV
jgi:hypothetical protein